MSPRLSARLDVGFYAYGRAAIQSLISLVLWIGGLLTFGITGFVYLVLSIEIQPRYLHPFLRRACRIILLSCGQHLRIEGEWPPLENGPYIYIFNHASMFDVFIMSALIPEYTCAVGKIQQFKWPFWGWIITRYGAIPIKRDELQPAIESLKLAEECIKSNQSMVIAPEGTRTLTGEMLPFKKGAFHVTKNTGATIIPIGVRGAFKAKRKFGWQIRPGIISAHIGEPITPSRYATLSVNELRDFARAQVQQLANQ